MKDPFAQALEEALLRVPHDDPERVEKSPEYVEPENLKVGFKKAPAPEPAPAASAIGGSYAGIDWAKMSAAQPATGWQLTGAAQPTIWPHNTQVNVNGGNYR